MHNSHVYAFKQYLALAVLTDPQLFQVAEQELMVAHQHELIQQQLGLDDFFDSL